MSVEYEKAKKIFTAYDGNKFQMQRDGVFEEYQSYNVPLDIQLDWEKEYIDNIKKNIESVKERSKKLDLVIEYIEASKRFYNNDSVEMMDDFMRREKKLDSYTKIRLIEFKLNTITETTRNKEKIIGECIDDLRELTEQKIVVDKSYYNENEFPDYLSTEMLEKRIKNLINYWQKNLIDDV